VICSELQNLIFDRKEVNPGALRATCGGPSAWSEANFSELPALRKAVNSISNPAGPLLVDFCG
jgi:hypothetical protein